MKILGLIYSVLVAFVVIVAILLIVSVLPINRLPGGQAWNYKVMTVVSGSMEPDIKMGSVVVVKPVPSTGSTGSPQAGSGQASDYKIGDVITFGPYSKTKAPTTHRIYEIKVVDGQPVYITKGDANNSPDAREIKKGDILGKVLFSVPYVGYAVEFAKQPLGFALIIIVPAAVIIVDEIKKIIQEIHPVK